MIIAVVCLLLLTGCLRTVPVAEDTDPLLLTTPATSAAAPTAALTHAPTIPPAPTATPNPAAPAILLERTINGHPFYLIRYLGPYGTCIVPTFDTRVLTTTRCGEYSGAGVGMVDTLTDPAGGTVRLAYGLALDPAITAVAVEFSSGGNANTFVENGGYALVLAGGQTPRRAVAVNQFGNLVDQWAFE